MTASIRNAIVESATLGIERGFMLDSWLHVTYGDSTSQGFGGWALHLGETATHHAVMSPAGHWIYRVLEIAGVESWDKVKGKAIRVRVEGDRIVGIGHIVKDDWFIPAVDFRAGGAK